MKKIGLIAAAATLAAAGAAFGQGTINLELAQPLPSAGFPLTDFASGPATWDGTGGSFSITLYVRAAIVGDPSGTGLTTFDGRLSDGGDSGSFSRASILIYEANAGTPYFPGGTDFPTAHTGMFAAYRATIGDDNNNVGNGLADGDDWTFLPLAIAQTGAGGANGVLANVYKFTWTTDDPTARTVTLSVGAVGGGYQSTGGLVTTDSIDGGTFTITIVPAPGAAALLGLGGLVAIRRRR